MQYALLARQDTLRPRDPELWSYDELEQWRGDLWAIDFETKGLNPWEPGFQVITLGMANEYKCIAIDWRSSMSAEQIWLLDYLLDSRLIAFNTLFDAGALKSLVPADTRWPWVGDAYALFKTLSTEGANGQKWNLDTAINDVLGWPESTKASFDEVLKEHGMTKADLWQLPHEVLAPYCAGDAEAAWQLWQYLITINSKVNAYHQNVFMPQVKLLLQQAWNGMRIDRGLLRTSSVALESSIDAAHKAFFDAPRVRDWQQGEPRKFASLTSKQPTARWRAWNKAQRTGEVLPINPRSKAQMHELFFGHLGNVPRVMTPSGKPKLDKKILPYLGDEGRLLAEYNALVKRRGYMAKVIKLSSEDGVIHPTFNSVGTATLRPSGTGGFNMLQMPKTPDLLAAFTARPGFKLVQADIEALEPTILAQFSKCPAMLSIYGDGAPPNDIYLFVASKIPALGKEILKYYDPNAPTAESVALAKKHCARDRQIAKTVHLACVYGAYPPKIHQTLALEGIDITLAEVKTIWRDYWVVFAAVKHFERLLQQCWSSNHYIPSIIGTPLPIAKRAVKDVLNRFCQTSGSIVLQTWVRHIESMRATMQIPAIPWNCNFYDETVWEVPEPCAEIFALITQDALTAANAELQVSVPFKAPPLIVDNLAQIKCKAKYDAWKGE